MRKFLPLLLIMSPIMGFAQSDLSGGYEQMTINCEDYECVQNNIQMIDTQIAALVAKRLAYVKRGAEIKNHDVRLPKEPGGYSGSGQSPETAKAIGGSPGATGNVFKELNKQSDEYEKQFLKKGGPQGQSQQQQQQHYQPLRQLEPALPHPDQQPQY